MVMIRMKKLDEEKIRKFRVKKELSDFAINEYAYTISDGKKLSEMKDELIGYISAMGKEVAEEDIATKINEKVIVDEKTTETQIDDHKQKLETDVSFSSDAKGIEPERENPEVKQKENLDHTQTKIVNFIHSVGSKHKIIPPNKCQWKNKKMFLLVYPETFLFIDSIFNWDKDFTFIDISKRQDKQTVFSVLSSIIFYKKLTLKNVMNGDEKEFSIL